MSGYGAFNDGSQTRLNTNGTMERLIDGRWRIDDMRSAASHLDGSGRSGSGGWSAVGDPSLTLTHDDDIESAKRWLEGGK